MLDVEPSAPRVCKRFESEVLSEFSGLAATRGRVQESKSLQCLLSKGRVCSVMWSSCSELRSSYDLYNLGSVGWQLHVAEFDGVKRVLTYYPKDGSAVLVWSSYSELQS